MVVVQVGSADSSGTEAHRDLAILRARRLRAILNSELFGSMDDTSNHRGLGGFLVLEESVSVKEDVDDSEVLSHLVRNVIRLTNRQRDNR